MKYFTTFFTLVVLALTCQAQRPNVMVILTDDMRFDQMTHMDHPYVQTPNLDRLAAEGMRFTQAYASTPLCGPSRMTFLSGQLPSAHRRLDNFCYPNDYEAYLPKDFKEGGFRTALIGKYYEGPGFEEKVQGAVWDFWFKNLGPDFSTYTGQTTKERTAFYHEHLYYDQMYEVGNEPKVVKGHQTDILHEQAVTFALQDPETPFFAFVAPFAPHGPFNPTLRRKGKYTGKGIPMKENIEFGVGYMTPRWVKRFSEVHERTCEMIEDLDEGLGRILDALEKSGQLDNTVIVFTSDNGVMHGEHGFGWKRHPWQEAVKVPLIIRYPQKVKAGSVCDAPVVLADVLPTCADLAGVELRDDPQRYGRSLVPLLTGKADRVREDTLLLQYGKGVQGKEDIYPEDLEWVSVIDSKGWKLIRYRIGPDMRPDYGHTFLFNLNDDPLEMNNLAGSHPERVDELKRKIEAQLADHNEDAGWL